VLSFLPSSSGSRIDLLRLLSSLSTVVSAVKLSCKRKVSVLRDRETIDNRYRDLQSPDTSRDNYHATNESGFPFAG